MSHSLTWIIYKSTICIHMNFYQAIVIADNPIGFISRIRPLNFFYSIFLSNIQECEDCPRKWVPWGFCPKQYCIPPDQIHLFVISASHVDISHHRHYRGSGLFSSRCTFQPSRTRKFWLCCCEFTHFLVYFTGLNNAVVSQNLQISGMLLTGLIQHRFNGFGTTGFHICCNDTLPFK